MTLQKTIQRLRTETGQTSSEYAIVLGVITTAIVLAMTQLGAVTSATIQRVLALFP